MADKITKNELVEAVVNVNEKLSKAAAKEIVDAVFPFLCPLLLVFACYKAIQKKVSGTWVMVILLVLGVVLTAVGIL